MDIRMTFRHMDATDGLKTYAQEKVDKLTKYILEPAKLNLIFSVDRVVHGLSITLFEKRHVFKAEGKTNDMYASIDQAMHNLEQQLRRYKEKVKNHKNYFKTQEALLNEAHDLHDEEHLSVERTHNRVAMKKKIA